VQTSSPLPPRTDTAEIAAHLRLVVVRAARRLRTEANGGLGPSLGAALATIDRFGPLTPSGVAEREAIQRPSATRLIARLEEEGLVSREPDPADGRSSLVAVTPAGAAHLAAVRSRKDAFLADRLDGLDPDDRATLDRAADILERLLEDRADRDERR
jgi:DNA-binding MarR family transcriptional regulator